MRLLIAAGGTGGHIYPALAVARSLLAADARAGTAPRPGTTPRVTWVGGQRGLEGAIVPPAGFPLRRLVLRSLRTVDLDVHAILDPIRLILSIPQALLMLVRSRPAAIFTTGGYVAVPVLLAAALLRIPTVLWEGNVIPGRAVRLTARLADVLAVSFPATAQALAPAMHGRPSYVTGTPIRDLRGLDRDAARTRLGIPAGSRVLLVFGGSQAVRRFNTAVAEALPELIRRVTVIHVTGDAGYAEAVAARDALPAEDRDRYRPHAFLGEEMADALGAADLVVGRAGSSTLAETSALGLPMIVVPYPHAAGHQRANARELVESGAARFVEDADFDAGTLLEAAALLDDPGAHLVMSAAARSAGRPGATDAVAAIVLAAAERRPLPSADEVESLSRGTAA
jgi:UDP-N-acetylglucosamine--N-acetylmuramyl-(pentapeptide) pyrophosphoryl-undecaprenol N-acetylglucosamine transferase